jgi:hypothetical protein
MFKARLAMMDGTVRVLKHSSFVKVMELMKTPDYQLALGSRLMLAQEK